MTLWTQGTELSHHTPQKIERLDNPLRVKPYTVFTVKFSCCVSYVCLLFQLIEWFLTIYDAPAVLEVAAVRKVIRGMDGFSSPKANIFSNWLRQCLLDAFSAMKNQFS